MKDTGELKVRASVKIMISHNWCQFEVCLDSGRDMTMEEIDGLRKKCQLLVDKAVIHYKGAKKEALKKSRIAKAEALAAIGLE